MMLYNSWHYIKAIATTIEHLQKKCKPNTMSDCIYFTEFQREMINKYRAQLVCNTKNSSLTTLKLE